MDMLTRCPDEGTLRAFLDDELPADQRAAIQRHLSTCPACGEKLAELRGRAAQVYAALSGVQAPQPSTRAAWQRFEVRQEMRTGHPLRWRLATMWQLLRYRHWRIAVAGTALVALLVAVMAVDPLRTAAAHFLSIFRVQQFTVIQVDASQMEKLKNFDQKIFVDTQMDKTPPVDVSSTEEASRLAGFTVLTPSRLPQLTPNRTEFTVAEARTATTQVNLAAARALLQAADLPTDAVPAGQDTIEINASIPPQVTIEYKKGQAVLTIVEAHSPEVEVPDGVDMKRLGEVGLQLMGLPADQARELSQQIDWATTLVMPVPTNVATVEKVTVRNQPAYLMRETATKGKPSHSVLLWQENGILYGVGGTLPSTQIMDVADSLQ